ncbi:MAG: rRNA maturation RNase YbeY [Planctomycetaceae bacterium]|nr:rRNA maturation RNase YbeY [Planctomycetaceae bacterium]
MSFEIDICDNHPEQSVDVTALKGAVEHALSVEEVRTAVLSVTIVDDATIHQLNRDHLAHDYPTDVISFQLEWSALESDEPPLQATGRSRGASIEGEIVASLDYARQSAPSGDWSTAAELTLYVIHGLLHICGYDDLSSDEKRVMRERERSILGGLDLHPVYPDDDQDTVENPLGDEDRAAASRGLNGEDA